MAAELCAALKMLLQMLLARAAAQTFFAMDLGKINIGTSFSFLAKERKKLYGICNIGYNSKFMLTCNHVKAFSIILWQILINDRILKIEKT